MSRFVLSSVEKMMSMLHEYPKTGNIPAFQSLKQLGTVTKGAGCCPQVDLSKYQPQFQRALTALTAAQKQQLKTILGVTEICYYSQGKDGTLTLNCS